jgi:hypothetical protein
VQQQVDDAADLGVLCEKRREDGRGGRIIMRGDRHAQDTDTGHRSQVTEDESKRTYLESSR